MSTLASRGQGSLDFVIDCGADPTGVADCTPALNRAYARLSVLATNAVLPHQAAELLFPPGQYSFLTMPTVWNFVAGTNISRITLRGYGEASILFINVGAANNFWNIGAPEVIEFRDLVLVGADHALPDALNVLQLSADSWISFRDVRIMYLRAVQDVLQLGGAQQGARFDNVEVTNCGSETAGNAVVHALCSLDWIRSFGVDNAHLNGYVFTFDKTSLTTDWMFVDLTGNPGPPRNHVRIDVAVFDEGCGRNLRILGDVGVPLQRVSITDTVFNVPGHAFSLPAVSISNVQAVEFDGCTWGDNGPGKGPGSALQLRNVPRASLDAIWFDSTQPAFNYVDADVSVGSLYVGDDTALTSIQAWLIGCPWTWRSDAGTLCDVIGLSAAVGVAAGMTLKPTAAPGATKLATTDDAGQCSGISIDTVAASAKVRSAKSGQPVNVLNDGAAVIAVGDKIIPSGALAGAVTHSAVGGTGTLGVALTGAGALAGAPFQIQFMPSVV